MSKIKIVSDGTAPGTRVYCGDEEITGITKIQINEILPGKNVTATLTMLCAELDIECETENDLRISKLKIDANQ